MDVSQLTIPKPQSTNQPPVDDNNNICMAPDQVREASERMSKIDIQPHRRSKSMAPGGERKKLRKPKPPSKTPKVPDKSKTPDRT